MVIRQSKIEDIPVMLRILAVAKQKMRAAGNANQWEEGYPSVEVLENDIKRGFSYVIEDGDNIIATFVLAICADPAYAEIYDGAWLDDESEYGTIHRIGSLEGYHGVMTKVLDFCFSKISNIRVDTHKDNLPMRHLMKKNGFSYCGVIHLANERGERLAYQKILK